MTDESAKSLDFFPSNKLPTKETDRKYSTTRIKLRNFLSNISYVGINEEDFYHQNFIFDIYLLMIKNLNPSSLGGKLNDPNKHEIIYMIWKECMPVSVLQVHLQGREFSFPQLEEHFTTKSVRNTYKFSG